MKNLYRRVFAKGYDTFMKSTERGLFDLRKELISELHGDILEIGVGTGVNFKFYNKNSRIIAIDPSSAMISKGIKKIPDGLDLKLLEYGATDDAFIKYIGDKKFDAIVCTLVLCTIPDVEKALSIFYDILKDDGKLVVMEHIQHKSKGVSKIMDFFNPAWNIIGDGCNINRHTDVLIKGARFVTYDSKREKYFTRTLPFYTNVFKKDI